MEKKNSYKSRYNHIVQSNPAVNSMPIKNRAEALPFLLLILLTGLLMLLAVACSEETTLSVDDTDNSNGPKITHDTFFIERSEGIAINNANIMVGSQRIPWDHGSTPRAIRWSVQGGVSSLVGLEEHTAALGINDRGDIVGVMETNSFSKGFAVVDGSLIELEKIHEDDITRAISINNEGTIVGVSNGHTVVWQRADDGSYGLPTELGRSDRNFGLRQNKPHINIKGEIAAVLFDSTMMDYRAAIVQPDQDGRYGAPVWLGSDQGDIAIGGINDSGVVVGNQWVWLPENYDEPISLLIGRAMAINNHNQIAGIQGNKPALWTLEPDGQISDPHGLDFPETWSNGHAHDINDNGWVTGYVWLTATASSNEHAAVWRPVD